MTTDPDPLSIRKAQPADAEAIASLYLASRADALPFLRPLHTQEDVRSWIRDTVLPGGETFLAHLPQAGPKAVLVGFMTLAGPVLEQLYLRPGYYRRGIGSRLLAEAKDHSPGRLRLYTFQRNHRARAFYERHGFVAVALNDGARNQEREPDILYEWSAARSPRQPVP